MPLSKSGKLLVLSGITPYRIVSISILYILKFLVSVFVLFDFLSRYIGGPHVYFSLSVD